MTPVRREDKATTDESQSRPFSARVSVLEIVADAARHAIPPLRLYAFGGDVGSYLLLTAFDLAIGLIFIVVSTREHGDVTSVDPRSRLPFFQALSVVVAAPMLGAVAAVIALPIAIPVYLAGLELGFAWRGILTDPTFAVQVAGMALLAAGRFQMLFYQRTAAGALGLPTSRGPVVGDLEGDRGRSIADYAAQVTLIATFIALSYVLLNFGRAGVWALPALYAAALIFYDARPDLARRMFPELWRRR